jgi:hypothetical protein
MGRNNHISATCDIGEAVDLARVMCGGSEKEADLLIRYCLMRTRLTALGAPDLSRCVGPFPQLELDGPEAARAIREALVTR